jgi:hypothetical protein
LLLKSDYGGLTTASADETAARLTINPIAEIANIRSMAALHFQHRTFKHGHRERQVNISNGGSGF